MISSQESDLIIGQSGCRKIPSDSPGVLSNGIVLVITGPKLGYENLSYLRKYAIYSYKGEELIVYGNVTNVKANTINK